MDSYVKTITLDVNADQNYTIVKAKQGDKINRKIAITLKKDGANFTPTGVSEIWFRVEKPDKNIAIVKSTDSGNPISVSGNVYTVSLSEQCLTASGKAWCDLAFLDSSGNTLSSCAFIMNIIPMPNGNTAESISEWTDLQKAIDDAERFADIVAFRTSGNYIQYTVDGQTWTNLVNVGAIGGDLQKQIDDVKDSVAQTYNADTTYNVGEYAYRPSDRKLYRCIQNTSGAWNYAAWSEVTVSDELKNVKGSLNTVENSIAIVANGNTHGAIAKNQYVYVKGHESLSTGLYIATNNISANAALSTSNLSSVPNGGFNEIPKLSSDGPFTRNNTNTTAGDLHARVFGGLMYISGYLTLNGSISGSNTVLGEFPSGYHPSADFNFMAYANYNSTGDSFRMMRLKSNGQLVTQVGSGTLTGQIIFPNIVIPFI